MNWSAWIESWGEPAVLAMGGLLLGLSFGFFGQRSKFCLRAAVIEFWHRRFGEKLSVWLLAFSTAVVVVQALVLLGWMDVSSARQLSARGSLSGALVGGLLFGVGMVMTRGCASRLLVLSANGNLRALLSGLIFAVVAQATLGGMLAPWREAISAWWMVEGGASRDLLQLIGAGPGLGLAFGLVWMAAALYFAARSGGGAWKWVGGMATGLTVAGGWYLTHQVMVHSFEVVQIQGLTFSGPSSEWLMHVLNDPHGPWTFGLGLMPGVFLGSLAGALVGREWKLEGFGGGYTMPRYIAGAVLMGFGSMLAGGCAVGAGMTGGAIFALTAWLALVGMWVGGGLADRMLDHHRQHPAHAPIPATPAP
ncbi:YeeE/YedE family protein [Macromonas nakdongensis]|uniref:YeeE/YedE family protein n=1 Tax=Macromonas nakdongensis TaxID=1843082 RepID=UPI001E340E21|nr:YeeE/YedE family protein [Macromonas nakdongensis]